MKKIILFFLMAFTSVGLLNAQSNSTGGANYYNSANLYGKAIASLTSTGHSALVWVDGAHGNDGVVDGLTNKGYSVTVATSASNFTTQLQTGNFDLSVLFVQNQSATSYNISTAVISNYIASGKSMIFATWTADDLAYANLFDASFSGSTNLTTVTLTDPILANGITNPIVLSNSGWFIGFSMGLIAHTGAEVLATFENGNAAIVRGNGGNTIILGYLSDAPALANRQAIFENVDDAVLGGNPVPIPYFWIILAFIMIAAGVVFSKRKVIFS